LLGDQAGQLPLESLWPEEGRVALFFEGAGTVLVRAHMTEAEYSYRQVIGMNQGRVRHPQKRTHFPYHQLMLRQPGPALRPWTVELLRTLVEQRRYRRYGLSGRIPRAEGQPLALAPRLWEPVAQLLTEYLAHSGEYAHSMNRQRVDEGIDPVLDFLTNVKN